MQRVHIAVTLGRLRRGEAYVLGGVSVVEVQVVGLAAVPVAGDAVGLVHVGLKTGDGQKAVVLQFGVPAVVTVVGEGDDGVAFFRYSALTCSFVQVPSDKTVWQCRLAL